MNLTSLTNDELALSITRLTGNEREVTLSILEHLIEIDKRELYVELGYSSLFDYCNRCLGYSEGSSFRRMKEREITSPVKVKLLMDLLLQ